MWGTLQADAIPTLQVLDWKARIFLFKGFLSDGEP
jgi:hypothetical protein